MRKALICVILLLAVAPPTAGAAPFPLGVRAGFSTDDSGPEQIHVGCHFQAAEPTTGVVILPSLEVGFGDHVTFWAVNGDVLYTFPELESANWKIFAGGGAVWNTYDPEVGNSNSNFGLNAVAGVARKLSGARELFAEARFGLEDSQDFKLTIGLTFF